MQGIYGLNTLARFWNLIFNRLKMAFFVEFRYNLHMYRIPTKFEFWPTGHLRTKTTMHSNAHLYLACSHLTQFWKKSYSGNLQIVSKFNEKNLNLATVLSPHMPCISFDIRFKYDTWILGKTSATLPGIHNRIWILADNNLNTNNDG